MSGKCREDDLSLITVETMCLKLRSLHQRKNACTIRNNNRELNSSAASWRHFQEYTGVLNFDVNSLAYDVWSEKFLDQCQLFFNWELMELWFLVTSAGQEGDSDSEILDVPHSFLSPRWTQHITVRYGFLCRSHHLQPKYIFNFCAE